MEQLKTWWAEASPRDQIAIMVLGACLSIYVLFNSVLGAVSDMRVAQEQRVRSQQQAYERIKNLAAELSSQESDSGFSSAGANVEKMVQASFNQHGLRVSGFDASGRSGIRVRFEAANYEALLAWFYDIEVGQGLHLKDVTIAGLSDPGLVSASVLIQK